MGFTRGFWVFALIVGLGAQAEAGTITFGNGIYTVNLSDSTGGPSSIGSWNAITGASHPAGTGRDLLYDASYTDTNFSSLRVFSPTGSTTDYTFGGEGGGTNMDTFFTSEGASPFGANGRRTIWTITPAGLLVTQDLFITGSAFGDSAIYHSVQIRNLGSESTNVGWRNLYDWAVNDPGFDDGPNNQVETSGGGVVVPATTFEFSHTPAAGEVVRVTVDPGVSTYEPLLGIGYDPGFSPATPATVPDIYEYVDWSYAFGTAFDYVMGGSDVSDDSAGLSWFGRDFARSIFLAPGQSTRITQVIFGVLPDAPPPGGDPTAPEPASLLLLAAGVAALGCVRRRRRE